MRVKGKRRPLFSLMLFLGGLYFIVQAILGSRPVQSRVVQELRNRLLSIGYDLEIQSIELSLLTPKIYFNGVRISSRPGAIIPIPSPIPIEKLRITFEPFALLQKRIAIAETVFFRPKISLPEADRFYRKLESLVSSRKQIELEGGDYPISVKTVGVVDASVNMRSAEPPFSVKADSITFSLTNSGSESQSLQVETNYIEIVRKDTDFTFSKIILDIDRSQKSIRVNDAQVRGEGVNVVVRGTSAWPIAASLDAAGVNCSIDASIPLAMLTKIPALEAPRLKGRLDVKGSLSWSNHAQTGKGTFHYEDVGIEEYEIGTGTAGYEIKNQRLTVVDLKARYGRGEVTAPELQLELEKNYAIHGEGKIAGLELDGLLDAIDTRGLPLRMTASGSVRVSGNLKAPLKVELGIRGQAENFLVIDTDKSRSKGNNIIRVDSGEIDGLLDFSSDRMEFQAQINTLGGKAMTSGALNFDHTAKVHVEGSGLSLTQLGRIADVGFGGTVGLFTDIDVKGKEVKIVGSFETTEGRVADILLGSVKGNVYFQNALLSFENLVLATDIQPVVGSGYLDFKPNQLLYRFSVDARRISTNQVFHVFDELKLPFRSPSDGELSGKLTVAGGHDKQGIEVISQGVARNFNWYGENWVSGSYNVSYRPSGIDLPKALLVKNSGALEVGGHFEEKKSRLTFKSHGLRMEELSQLGGAPFSGEVHGELTFEGDLSRPEGTGHVQIPNLAFRQKALGVIDIDMFTADRGLALRGKGFANAVEVVVAKAADRMWSLDALLRDVDVNPVVSALLRKDIESIDSIILAGSASLKGDIWDWQNMEGNADVQKLVATFRGSQMALQNPTRVRFGKEFVGASDFELKGNDAELRGGFSYESHGNVKARVDGKLDLQFVQPFIPFLDYGVGKLNAGLRMEGPVKKFSVFGHAALEDGTLRVRGLTDEIRGVNAQVGVSQEILNIERFEGTVNGGQVLVAGDVAISRFTSLKPSLVIKTSQVLMNFTDSLSARFSGQFRLAGTGAPYELSGKCMVQEGKLTTLKAGRISVPTPGVAPAFRFDIDCSAPGRLLVATEVFNSDFHGDVKIRGNSDQIGLLGSLEASSGVIVFRDTKFNVSNANVRFESEREIVPRFNIQSRAMVKETSTLSPQEYEVLLQVLGVPSDYKIRLSATPRLTEPEIISLLVLGVTSKTQGGYADLGSALSGSIPVPSKLQNELGVDIKLNSQTEKGGRESTDSSTDVTVPSVKVEKSLTSRTKLSYSNTLSQNPSRELRIEQILDDNLTANFSTANKPGLTPSDPLTQSYGVDIRYRFDFE
ncbi:MAG: translocation/assembly module TamB domain-containing protein [Deltaproteobacteria bacterium]|nr:translocation/assembly module TamB domain-containing protein [Deltaproteobacteria bacterium]